MSKKISINYVKSRSKDYIEKHTDLEVNNGIGYESGIIKKKQKIHISSSSKSHKKSDAYDFYVKFKDDDYESFAKDLAEYLEKGLNKETDETVRVFLVNKT